MMQFFALHIAIIDDVHPAVQHTLACSNHQRGCSTGPECRIFVSSFGALNGAIEPACSTLEEAVLFLGIAESVRTRCFEISSFTWAILSEILSPSAQTLKAVMLLLASARGILSVCSLDAAYSHCGGHHSRQCCALEAA